MKQFISSLVACIISYFIGALIAADFNISKWNEEGRYWFGILLLMCWCVPMLWNLIQYNPNFSSNKKTSIDESFHRF